MSRSPLGAPRRAPSHERLDGGIELHVETDRALPFVDVVLVFRGGAARDPEGKEGLARLHARLLRRGTSRMKLADSRLIPSRHADEIDEAIERLGGSLSVEVGSSTLRVGGSVIRRNLEAYFAILASLVVAPAFRRDDLAFVRREATAGLVLRRDDDRWLAARTLRHALFGAHPYGRASGGTARSIEAIRLADVKAHQAAVVRSDGLVVGFAGDVGEDVARALVQEHLSALPRGPREDQPIDDPPAPRGLSIWLVDKPDRTQAQLLLGTRGVRFQEPAFYPMVVANTVFGGTFSARLVKEVRSERGYSYTAESRLFADRARDAWTAYTHPSIADLPDCLALELRLFRALALDGVRPREVAFAKSYLEGSHAFGRDTAGKRLEPHLEASVFGGRRAFFTDDLEQIRAVDAEAASRAVRRILGGRGGRGDDLVVTVVAPRKLERALAAIPGVTSLQVLPHTEVEAL